MEMESGKLNAFFSSSHDSGKVLIEDDRENGGGKGRVGEIIHHPAEDFLLLNWHIEVKDGETVRQGNTGTNSPRRILSASRYLLFSASPYLSLSDCPDLLPHENEVADPETEKGDGYDRNQVRRDDDKALQKWKGILKTA